MVTEARARTLVATTASSYMAQKHRWEQFSRVEADSAEGTGD